ncbi:hypothetical protein BJ741DRAFT_44689 [Chytriomyces cf. hyalinus JEL632]|nr:hypothetical protein BJ741DRAFT_44689 [Chytriomyces cf. hyalinus JEL632]
MDRLPIEVIQSIVMYVEIDEDQLECVKAILKDPLGRVNQKGRDRAFTLSAYEKMLPIPTLLIQHGILPQALNEALLIAVPQNTKEFVSLLLMQPGMENGLQQNLHLEEAVMHDNVGVLKGLLDDGQFAIVFLFFSFNQSSLFCALVRKDDTVHSAVKKMRCTEGLNTLSYTAPRQSERLQQRLLSKTRKKQEIFAFWIAHQMSCCGRHSD